MARTKIEWATHTINTVTGCTPASEGCTHCFAAKFAKRFWGDRPFSDVRYHPDRIAGILKGKAGYRVFLDSMTDLFHPAVEREWLDEILEAVAARPDVMFMILTKRPENIDQKLYELDRGCNCRELGGGDFFPNLWIGVTVENQQRAEERIPTLVEAWHGPKFLSCEPLLEEVDLGNIASFSKVNWVIVGKESGHGARIMQTEWAAHIHGDCLTYGIPYFHKSGPGRMVDVMCKQYPSGRV
jgi:protein gp37